jgi:hypothetical protein
VTVMVCRVCGHHNVFRSGFEAECTECGSDDLELEDAYDPIERDLRCEYCGYRADTATRPDAEWTEDEREPTPSSVDDPCPICGRALVPASEASDVRAKPEFKVAQEAGRRLHREHTIPGPPYELDGLAIELGLEIVRGSFDHDGLLAGARIEIPQRASAVVQRFAIAHEIGHHVLRHEGERSKLEPEANAFASELLIPRAELAAAIATTPSAKALRTHFGVSRQALVYALMSARAIDKVRP